MKCPRRPHGPCRGFRAYVALLCMHTASNLNEVVMRMLPQMKLEVPTVVLRRGPGGSLRYGCSNLKSKTEV